MALAPTPLSLAGLRVLDLSRVLAGPWCTQLLGDLGADVVKVERPGSGDDTRGWGPPFLHDRHGAESSESAYFLGANRNKRSIAIDLAHPDGQALVRALVLQADVLVENYKVGDMARYGLDFVTLHALNPQLVYCSITGYGQTGPYHERAGYDYAVQGLGGLMSLTGERDDLPGGGPQRWAWRSPTCSPACMPASASSRPCGTATPRASVAARASTSIWRCSTRRWRCWPTWAPTTS
ncbi:Formyl-coenzyme A transferase [Methylibium sp. T29-B]|nr:Formyl-coenzyme A transferase [Methylibium sp. T29-B]